MERNQEIISLSDFAKDTLDGLSSSSKFLLSKYFYDERGSSIFQDIMQMHEYYLTDCELEIFSTCKSKILSSFLESGTSFDLIELGAGDGLKTKVLLSYFQESNTIFRYSPIDISHESINVLVGELADEFPKLKVDGLIGDYFNLIGNIVPVGYSKKVILFLGSNIGNFTNQMSLDFLQKLKNVMSPQDLLFIGFDLKKDPQIIIDAYNDPHGYTADFNINLLRRINNELDANFNLDKFTHTEEYDPVTGTASSYLISDEQQTVVIQQLEESFKFKKGERIFTEISQKYDLEMINELASQAGFEVIENFFDNRRYFVNSLWKPKN